MAFRNPAIGVIELNSIARGMVACDAMVKRAPVRLLEAHSICAGKFMILINGEVADVEEAMEAGLYYAGHTLVDKLLLPYAHEQIPDAVTGTSRIEKLESVGIIETFSVASCILAADAAAKAAKITLIELRLAAGLGGKAYLTLTGELHDVEAAIEAGVKRIESGMLVKSEIIPAPHPEFGQTIL